MREIYRRSSIFSFIGGSIAAIYSIVFYFVWYEGFSVNSETLVISGISAIMLIGSGFYFNNAQKSLGNETTGEVEVLFN